MRLMRGGGSSFEHPSISALPDPATSRASPLPQGGVLDAGFVSGGDQNVGAGLLAKASVHSTSLLADIPLSRASPLPQGEVFRMQDLCRVEIKMWERACSRRRQFIQHLCWLTYRFREQARSHRRGVLGAGFVSGGDQSVEAGLLAKASVHSTSLLADIPPSRASPLPQGEVFRMQDLCRVEIKVWERACSRRRQFIQHLCWLTYRFREQARSHRGGVLDAGFVSGGDHSVGDSMVANNVF